MVDYIAVANQLLIMSCSRRDEHQELYDNAAHCSDSLARSHDTAADGYRRPLLLVMFILYAAACGGTDCFPRLSG